MHRQHCIFVFAKSAYFAYCISRAFYIFHMKVPLYMYHFNVILMLPTFVKMQADIDNSGTIDYGEFLAATLHLNKIEREDHLYAAFSYFDKDGSGYITQDELQQACEEFGMGDVKLEEVIREVDQDNVSSVSKFKILFASYINQIVSTIPLFRSLLMEWWVVLLYNIIILSCL